MLRKSFSKKRDESAGNSSRSDALLQNLSTSRFSPVFIHCLIDEQLLETLELAVGKVGEITERGAEGEVECARIWLRCIVTW